METNHQRKCGQHSRLALMAALLVRKRARCGQRGPHRILVVTAPLCECEGLRLHSLSSRLMGTVFVGCRQQRRSLVATALLSERECRKLLSPCGTLDVLTLNVGKDRVQRGNKKFACCLDVSTCGIKTTSWQGCLPARELAVDSSARVTASC